MADPKLTSFSSMFNALGNQQAPVADQATGSFSSALGGLGSTPAPAPAPTVTDQKRANVEETKVAKALALADDETLRTIAAAQINGNDLAENAILQELRTKSFGYLLQKYGPEVARNSYRILKQEMSLESALNASRSDSDLVKDTGVAVAQGAFNMAGGIQSLGLGMINDDLGTWSAGLIDQGSEWFDDQKSGTFRERMKVKGLMGALDDMDNEAQYQEDLADKSTVSASDTLRYWGRSAADEVGRVISDPAELGDFVAQNVGSLLPSTAAAKAAQAAAKGTRLAKAAVPTAVALGESGSAYVGAVNRVMEMTEEDLMQNSPDYRELRASGFTDEEARTEIATDAGMLAATVQFPVAAVAGKFVERFEASPLSGGGVGQVLKDIGSQTVEEAVQESTGQFNQNLGIQTFADENQRLDEGVVEGAALGALGGAGMAGIVKAPSALGSVAAAGAKAAGRGLQQAVDARRSQLEEQQDSQNPVGTTNTKTNLQNIDQTLNKVVTNTVANPSPTGEVDQAQVEIMSKIRSVAEVGTSELAQMPAAVKSMILSPEEESSLAPDQIIRRGAVMFALLDKMRSAAPEVRKEAVLWLNDQVNRLGSLQGIDLDQLDEVTRENISAVIQASNQVMSNSTVSKAVEEAATMTQADLGPLPDVTPETINTPEVQKAIGNTVALAQANPAGVDTKFIDTILEQTTNGTVNIDRAVADRLRLASHIAKTMQSAEANKETLVSSAATDEQGPARKSVAQVREEILRKGKNNDLNQYGLDRHMAEIMTAQAQGDTGRMSALMQNLRNFAESMQNKVAAANESIKIGDPSKNKVPYRAWTGSQWVETGSKNAKKFYVFPGSTNNVLTGRAVVEDATMVADLYDGLLERLGGAVRGEKVARVQADPLIAQAKAETAVEAKQEVAAEKAAPKRASDLPAESPEPEEAAPAKERPLRKNAIVKPNQSLIDESESDPVGRLGADQLSTEGLAREREEKRIARERAKAERAERRANRITKPTEKRPLSLREFVINAGGLWSGDPQLKGELDYQRPGFKKKSRLVRSTAGNNGGGRTADEMREIAAEAGYMGADTTVADFIDLLQDDINGDRVYAESDISLVMDWRDYDAAISERDRDEREADRTADPEAETQEGARGTAQAEGKARRGDERADATGEQTDREEAGTAGKPEGSAGSGQNDVLTDKDLRPYDPKKKGIYVNEDTFVEGEEGETVDLAGAKLAPIENVLERLNEIFDTDAFVLPPVVRVSRYLRQKGENLIGIFQRLEQQGETDESVVDLPREAYEALKDRDDPWYDQAVALYLHEHAHWLDKGHLGEVFYDTLKAEKASAGAKLKKYFDSYAETFKSKGNEGVYRQELLAETAAAAYLFGPEMQEEMPQTWQAISEFLASGGKRRAAATMAEPATTVTFPNLTKTAGGLSRVARAYVFSTVKSPFLALAAPARAVMERLRDHVNGTGKLDLGYDVPADKAKIWSGILGEGGKAIMDDMNARLTQAQSGIASGEMTVLEALQDETIDPTGWAEGKVLNLVDETTGAYDPRLQQLAVMAGFHWVFTQIRNPNPKIEDVAKMFGIQESDVTDEIMDMARRGMSTRLAKESLARTIMEFWGADMNKDAPMSDTLGIAQAMAIEVLVAMNGRFVFFERQKDTLAKGKIAREYFPIELEHESTKETVDRLTHTKGLLGEMLTPQAEKSYYIGDDMPPPPKTIQKRNFLGKLGTKILNVLGKHQQIEFRRNKPFLDALQALDQDTFFELMGYEPVEDGITNRKHRKSIEGKNKQIELSWAGVMAHNARIEAKAAETGANPDELISRFPWYVVSNERIHAAGFNPQSDKLMREALVSTIATLDMTDDAQRSLFWLTVGQSSGAIKTEGIYETESEAKWVAEFGDIHAATAGKVGALVRDTFGDAIDALKSWMERGDESMSAEERALFVTSIKEAKKGFTPKLFHSLLAVARYDMAGENEVKAFQHNLSLEADGKTDGPMAAIVNWSTGAFTGEELQNQRRGGFFLAQTGQTLNDQTKKKAGDLYEVAAKGTQAMLVRLKRNLERDAQTEPMAEQQHRLMRLLSAFSSDLKYDAETRQVVEVKRGLLKNPLTITIYGSGEKGIAGKVSREIIDGVYEAMTRVEKMRRDLADPSISLKDLPEFAGYPEIENDLRALAMSAVIRFKDETTGEMKWGMTKTVDGRPSSFPRNMGKDFELSPEAVEMINTNMLHLMVKPMRVAINSVVGNSMDNLKVFQNATQFMSKVMIERFREEVKKALAKRENKSEFLSQNEYEAIFQEMSKFGAIIAPIDSNNHHLNLSASETAQSAYTFSGGLDREFTGGASLAQPSEAGVGAAPLMTISRGDATMMVNYFASKDPDLRVLPVFDGLEMPADGIAEISERINKAVADAWLGENGAIDMRDSFRDFMQQGLNEDEKKEAGKLMPQLEEIALETEARKAVMRRVSYSMDHMASGRTPFNNEGEAFDYDPAALDYDEKLAEWLNVKLEEERANLAGAAQERAAQTGVEQENPAFMDLVKASGVAVGDMGVTRLTTTNMARVLQQLGERGGVTKEKMRVFQLLRPLLPEFTFLVGSKADLEAYRSHRFGVQGQALGMGQIDFRNGVVYVASGSPETVLHEMLHAVTMKLSLAYYDDPSSLSEGQKVAFKNLERLMEQFQGLDFTETTEASLEVAGEKISVATMLQRQLASLGQGKDALSKAKALNEFMAWTLTNQDLIETLKKTRVRAAQDGFLKGLLTEMVQIMRDSMKAVRKLLGFGSEVPMDMFSNIAFNTGMLVYGQPNAQPGVLVEPVGTVLQQTIGAPVDLRIQGIMEAFQTKVGVHLDNLAAGQGARPAEELNIYRVADEALNRVSANFFKLDDQQKQAFRVIQAYFASSTKFDSAALTRMEKVFAHVTGQLSVDSFVNDPTNPNDVIRAERMYSTLMGGMGYEMDRQGRSNLMATFVALSQVHPGFRNILKSIDLPKGMKTDFSSLDDILTTSAEKALDSLERVMSGDSTKNRTTLQSMDDLAAVLAVVRQDEQTRVEQMASGLLDKADTTGSKLLTKGADRLTDFADKLLLNQQAGIRGKAKETVAQSLKVVAALMDGERGLALAQALTSQLNTSDRMPLFIKELINDVIGMTDENEAIYSMVNRVKYAVSKLRQEYRTETPKVIAKQFTRTLLDKEWSAMHLMLGRTDLAALGSDKSMSEIIDLLQDKKKREIEAKRLMEVIRVKMPRMFPFYDEQAQNLARYMVTGEIDSETRVFHRNAEAIARLLGTGMNGTSDQEVIDALDQLVTLYALEMVPQDVADTTMNLIKTEKDGVEFVAYYLASIRQKEQSRVQGEVARFNSYKGYVPMETPDGASLKVADDADMKVLISQGYTRIGDYRGTGIEKGSKGYYYSAVSGRNTYSQGVMQTVHTSAFGVDPRTGFTVNGTTAGVIQGRAVPYIEKQMATRSKLGKETLMPVFDEKGNTVAYERSLDPQMVARLRRNDHIGEMLGAWAGRQSEEKMGQEFNRDLVKRTYDIYRQATGRRGEFVNLADPNLKDPILIDAWKMVPKDTKDYIEELYGEGEFWVRKDMVNATVGYRMPSVSDFWTGLSRMPPDFQKSFVDTATLIFGKNTFRYLVTAEKGWQTGVSMAKHIIVVSSVIVPVSNFLSNFVQLTLNGVPLRSIGKGMASKLVEIDQHLKHLDRMVEIQTLMARYQNDRTMTQKLEAELQSLKDADRRMSIWPLIEAGEFSTISEGLTELDGSLTEGKWADVMSRLSEKIPAQFGTVGRYAAITRDTALFKGMSRATQYGDFLARAVLYDHLLSQGKTKGEALLQITNRQITEEFVNYNFLPGRTMAYAESMGMIWFSAYKLRSMKVALNHLRNNPVRALLLNVNPLGVNLPGMDVGSPISDNLASVIADGRLGYSIGPGMLFRAPEMNPWVNLIN